MPCWKSDRRKTKQAWPWGGMGHRRSLSGRKTKSSLTWLRWELKELLSVRRWRENSLFFPMKLFLKKILKSRNKMILFWQDRVSEEENPGPYTQETGVLSLSHVHSLLSSINWWPCLFLNLENNTYILLWVLFKVCGQRKVAGTQCNSRLPYAMTEYQC